MALRALTSPRLLHSCGIKALVRTHGPQSLKCSRVGGGLPSCVWRRSRGGSDTWHSRRGLVQIRAVTNSASGVESDKKVESASSSHAPSAVELQLACPICHEPLNHGAGPPGVDRAPFSGSELSCRRCQRAFSTTDGIADLTIVADSSSYEERQQPGTSIFQSPLVAFVYERGWRQGFAFAGFPGVDEEFELAQKALEPARGGPLLDVSCGSGLFSRRFLASQDYAPVIASDFSTSMLQQCRDLLKEERMGSSRALWFVRADVGRLPFPTGSLAGVHAGAAIHCWPQPASAVAEISRVLRPGGVFVASTFLLPQWPVGGDLLKPLEQLTLQSPVDPYRWWREEELREVVRACGLTDFQRTIHRSFILFSARKPQA